MCRHTHITYDCGHTYQTTTVTSQSCHTRRHEPVFGINTYKVKSPAGKLCPQCEERYQIIMEWMEGVDRAQVGARERGMVGAARSRCVFLFLKGVLEETMC